MNSIQKKCETCIHRDELLRFPCYCCEDHDHWAPLTNSIPLPTFASLPISASKTFTHMFDQLPDFDYRVFYERKRPIGPLEIEKVIYNDPATIVIWKNGDKTVVKCQPGDIYDPEKGLALCIMKRALGNKGNYNNTFRKWLPEKGEQE